MRLLVISDVHLDAPFAWATVAIARRRRQALRDAFSRALALAGALRVDAVLLGGDLYEHDRVSPDTGEFLRSALGALEPSRVFIAPGNHDYLSPTSLYARVTWPPNVHVFNDETLRPVRLGEGVTLWGNAFTRPVCPRNPLEGCRVAGEGIHLALFHGSERTWLASQERGKQAHAPFAAADVELAGFSFAFLGHYHEPRQGPRLAYPGNVEPLAFGETGARGALLAEVHPGGEVTLTTHAVQTSEVHDIVIDVTGCASTHHLRQRVRESLSDRAGYARITLTGELASDVDLAEADLSNVGRPPLDAPPVVRVHALSSGYDLARVSSEQTVRGQFVRDVRTAEGLDEEERRRIIVTGLRALDGRHDLDVP